jgi:Pectate lyase superfamily protein
MARHRKRTATRKLMTIVVAATLVVLVVVSTLWVTRNSGGSAQFHSATASTAHTTAVTSCAPPSCFNVLNFGANPDGIADNSAAFHLAIDAAQANPGGGTVYVPAGTYAFTQIQNEGRYSISIPSTSVGGSTLPPVTLEGDGPNVSNLVEHVGGQALLGVEADGSEVEGLTLNARSYGGGQDVTVVANNTTITQDNIVGAHKTGVIGAGSHAPFALYFPGPTGASESDPTYNSGNTVSDTTIEDGINNDGFSFSFQSNGTISNIHHFGSRLAMFVDKDVTVTNYSYTPNPECLGAENGFYITGPSDNITITNFTTAGEGGVVDGPGATNPVTNVTIDNEQLTSPSGNHLAIGDVTNLTIENSSFNTGNELLIEPNRSAGGITIQNTTIPFVQIQPYLGSTYTSLSMAFNNDTFPAESKPTFTSPLPKAPGPTTFSIDGGQWLNAGGGFYNSPGASNITYDVTNLAPIPVGKPAITGTLAVGDMLTTTNGTWLAGQTPAPTFTYQWEDGGAPIKGATAKSFTPNKPGNYRVVVTAENPTGSTPDQSAVVAVSG